MKEYNYKIDSVSRSLTARVFAESRDRADEILKKELVEDWEFVLDDYDIELDYICDIVERVDVDERC